MVESFCIIREQEQNVVTCHGVLRAEGSRILLITNAF